MPKLLNIIVACAENRVIGRDRKLPWHIPEDLEFFHRQTAGQICVLGRVCYDTWPRAQKDGRQPIVLTSRPLGRSHAQIESSSKSRVENPEAPDRAAIPVQSLHAALDTAEHLSGEIYICGGERVYQETLALTNRPMRLHLTLVHAEVPGDTYFPEWRHLSWRETARRESADENWRYTFFTLEREPR